MTASVWPGYLVLTALACLAVGAVCFAASGAAHLARTVRRGRTTRPARTVWVVYRRSPVSGQWRTWGGPYDTEADALADYTETCADPLLDHLAFQMEEQTTTYRRTARRRPKTAAAPVPGTTW